MESIYHYSQLLGFFFANAFFHCTRMWAMWYASRMQGNHSPRYIFTAHEISINIVQQLIAIDVGMVVRGRNGLWMIIIHSGHKTANHKVVCIKSLMHRWWLVHTACNGFKIVDAENKWIAATIPPNYVKRMMGIMQTIQDAFLFCLDQKIAGFIFCLQILRRSYITFTVRSVF